jgi:hypothetical protein
MINSITINYSGDYDKQLDLMVRNFFATINVEVNTYNEDIEGVTKVPTALIAQAIYVILQNPPGVQGGALTFSGKIDAIKFLRGLGVSGLREAKDLVEIFSTGSGLSVNKSEELTFMRRVRPHLPDLTPGEVKDAILKCNYIIDLARR